MRAQTMADENAGPIFLICLFYAIHMVEEFSFGFVGWANRYFGNFDWTQNLIGNFMFFLCVLSACYLYYRNQAKYLWAGMSAAMWILSNSFIHISCTVLSGEYSPGVVTASLLYIPGGVYFLVRWGRLGWLSLKNVVFSFFVGGMIFMLIPTFARSVHFHAQLARLFHFVK
jgi:hypothetical protein